MSVDAGWLRTPGTVPVGAAQGPGEVAVHVRDGECSKPFAAIPAVGFRTEGSAPGRFPGRDFVRSAHAVAARGDDPGSHASPAPSPARCRCTVCP